MGGIEKNKRLESDGNLCLPALRHPITVVTSIHEFDVLTRCQNIFCAYSSKVAIVNKSQDDGESERQECQSRDHVLRS